MKHTASITAFAFLSLLNFNLQSTPPYQQKKVTEFFSRAHKGTEQRESELNKLRQAVLAIKAEQDHREKCAKAAEETNSNFKITRK